LQKLKEKAKGKTAMIDRETLAKAQAKAQEEQKAKSLN